MAVDDPAYRLRPPQLDEFLLHLPTLVPEGATLLVEGLSIVAPIADFCAAHAVASPPAASPETASPKSAMLFVPADPATTFGLSELSESHAEPEVCDHLRVFLDGVEIVSWCDVPGDPVFIAAAVEEDEVRAFCRATHGSYTRLR